MAKRFKTTLFQYTFSLIFTKGKRFRRKLHFMTQIFLQTLKAHDSYTELHSRSMAYYAILIAKELRLPDSECNMIYLTMHLAQDECRSNKMRGRSAPKSG